MPAVEGDATDGESVKDEDIEEYGKENSVGDRGRVKGREGEGKVEDISSHAMSKCSEIAVVAEYDVIDLCVKPYPYLTAHTPARPLRGAGSARGSRGDEHDMHHNREMMDKYKDAGKDGKKRVKINEEVKRSEEDSRMGQYVKKERDRDRDRISPKEQEKESEGEGEGGTE